MKIFNFLPAVSAFSNFDFEIGQNELCNLNYAACVEGDTSHGADCGSNPDLGADFLCTSQCDAHFNFMGGEKLDNYNGFCGFKSQSHCPPGGCVSAFGLDKIWQYGCWCNFDDNLTDGVGEPQNIYDSICRKFQLCLRCARMDGVTEGYGCDPKTDDYNMVGNPFFQTDCSTPNPGDLCGESLCSCNVNFIQRLFAQNWKVPSVYDSQYLHSEGFEPSVECPNNNSGPGGKEVQCCGYWPDRFPYGIGDTRGCCDHHNLFNPIAEQCCSDGSVKKAGEVC